MKRSYQISMFVIWTVALVCAHCRKADSAEPSIEAFEGRWRSDLAAMMDDVWIDMARDIREGRFVPFANLPEADKKEMEEELGKRLEEVTGGDVKRLMTGGSGVAAPLFPALFKEGNALILEIRPPDQFLIGFQLEGKESMVEEKGEYEMTSQEIVFRSGEESRLIRIEGDKLKVRNEREGYPKFITFLREAASVP